jgi:predicted SprT family Zn-dependent metalloprotease
VITEQYIADAYQKILNEVSGILPVDRWCHQPMGVGFTTEKTKYGLATVDGQVLINRVFIGTSAFMKLDHVLRHEFSHLAVGLKEHHNKRFQRMAMVFGVDPALDLSDELAQIQERIDFKYTVIAHMADGHKLDLGGVHRKTRTYTEYPRHPRDVALIKGVRVLRFEFIENARQ